MASSNSTEEALLQWINTFPKVTHVESLADLADGVAFSRILEDLDPDYAVYDEIKNINIPSKWLRKKKALETVYRSLLRYFQNQSHASPAELEQPINFDTIAEHGNIEQTIQLVTLFLIATFVRPEDATMQKYVNRLKEMEERDVERIQMLVQKTVEAREGQTHDSTPAEDATLPAKLTKELDLAFEAEHANLQAEHKALQKKHADYITRWENLKISYDELLEQSRIDKVELDKLKSLDDGGQADYVKTLRKSLEESNDLIASQERKIEENRVATDKDKKELGLLRVDNKRLGKLDDEVRELRSENQTLARKANKADSFQKKIEAQAVVEKENGILRQRMETLEINQKDYDKIHHQLDQHELTIQAYSRKLQNQETEIYEINQLRQAQAEDFRNLQAKHDQLTVQSEIAEKHIREFEERLRTGSEITDLSPDSPSAKRPLTLEQELEQSNDAAPNYLLQVSKLQAEIELLKSTAGGTTNANLRIDLEEAIRHKTRLQQNLQELTEQYAVGQQQLNAMIGNSSGEKDQVINHTRNLWRETLDELEKAKARIAQLQADISSKNRELLDTKATLAALDADDEMDALESLKSANGIIRSSLENDLAIIQDKHKVATVELEEKKSHLMDTLLSNNRLLQDLASLKERSASSNDPEADVAVARQHAEEELKNKTALEDLKERAEKAELTIGELQRHLKAAEDASPDVQKAANEAMIKNLRHENDLISTAWHDLTRRLQSNHLVLQRRQDAPKSWLNKQRQMLNPMPRR